jgi:hypothetical protein
LAAVAQPRSTNGNAGVIAAPVVLLLAAVTWFLPRKIALVVPPADPHWTAAHYRWAGILGAALVAFLWAGHERASRSRGLVLLGRPASAAVEGSGERREDRQ